MFYKTISFKTSAELQQEEQLILINFKKKKTEKRDTEGQGEKNIFH